MGINAYLTRESDSRQIFSDDLMEPQDEMPNGQISLAADSVYKMLGVFNAESRSTIGTTIVAQPVQGGSIVLTDMVFTTNRTQNAIATVRFTDGIRTENILISNLTNGPINLAIPFAGRFRGWRDARVELDMAGANGTATLTLGYIRVTQGLRYDAWDKLR